MPRSSTHTVHAICAALILAVVTPVFAQPKPPSLLGATREQVVARMGEPKSNIQAGAREMLFFAHLKVTLRNDVVIETEELADEPAPKHTAQPAAASSAVPVASPGQAGVATPTNAPAPANAPAPTTADASNASAGKSTPEASAAPANPPTPAEPPLEIKFIRSASSSAQSVPHPAPAAAAMAEPSPAVTAPVPAVEVKPPPSPPATTPAPAPTEASSVAVATPPAALPDAGQPPVVEEIPAAEPAPTKPAVDQKKKAALRKHWWFRRVTETDDEPVEIFSAQSYVIAAIVLIGGVAYLWWRWKQRNLELAATSVSSTPFAAAVAVDMTTLFTAELMGKLGQKRFERLVASYYAKTGVVAERTDAGPEAPIHIKIFWKGEPKPFAGVLCLANPTALIGPQRLQELFTALTAADIRRGYVVTTGKFNVEARDVAEEKHFTLLSGDLLLEKLNALPPAARGELLKETNAVESVSPTATA